MTCPALRILLLSPTVLQYIGGTETVVAQLARRLAPTCRLTVLGGVCVDRAAPEAPPSNTAPEAMAALGAQVVTVPFVGRDTALNAALRRALRLNPFKIESWSFFRSLARRGFDFGEFDAIVTFYEMDASLLARRYPAVRDRSLHLLPGVSRRRLFRDVGERNVVFLGYRGPARVQRKWGLRIPALPLGVDEAFFPPGPRPLPRARRLAFFGRLDGSKRVDWLAELFAHSDLRARGYTLDIVGDGPLAAMLRSRYGDTPGLRLHARMSPAQLIELLRDTHLVLHPSELESFGLTVLESMAAGVPVITHDLPGIRAWAQDRPVYAAHLDRGAWLAAVARFEDERLWLETSARNVAFARGFGWQSLADRVFEMLQARSPARAAITR